MHVTDHVSVLRMHRLRSTGEHSAEESNGAVWVADSVQDVLPAEFAHVIHGIEFELAARSRDRLRNPARVNVRHMDNGVRVLSEIVRSVNVALVSHWW